MFPIILTFMAVGGTIVRMVGFLHRHHGGRTRLPRILSGTANDGGRAFGRWLAWDESPETPDRIVLIQFRKSSKEHIDDPPDRSTQ